MKNIFQKFLYLFVVVILVFLATTAGYFFGLSNATVSASKISTETPRYVNDKMRFSVGQSEKNLEKYHWTEGVGEDGTMYAAFVDKEFGGDPGSFFVQAKNVSYKTTKEWLDAQVKSNGNKEGYEFLYWIDYMGDDLNTDNDFAIVAQYGIYEHDGDISIYWKYIKAYQVNDGTLYDLSPFAFISAKTDFKIRPDSLQELIDFRSGDEYKN